MPNRVALIGDLLVIAEAQIGTPAETLLRAGTLDADPELIALFDFLDSVDPAPSRVEEAAILSAWIIRNRPFSQDNPQISYRFMCALLDAAEQPWKMAQEDVYVVPAVFEALEAKTISEADFVDWVCLRVAAASR
jgi:hypothetical protein